MFTNNIILNTDSYKASHFLQYPEGTEFVHSYIEARDGGEYDQVLFFGLQMFLKELENSPVTHENIEEAAEVLPAHGEPFNREGWEYILNSRNGRLPVHIRAVKEGTVLPTGQVLVTVQNTDARVPWLTSYLETALLRAVWYPTTVATNSWRIKQTIREFLNATSDNAEAVLPFKLHDFGARGVSSNESAAIGSAAHLVNFMGSDTLAGIMAARKYYGEKMAGFSIPAAEHSTITSWGRDREVDAYRNMLQQFAGPGKIVAVVSDSYDLDNAVNVLWGAYLKREVEEQGGVVVIRPDSGDPVETPVRTIIQLMNKFGFETNSKGFAVLPPYIRVIQGDGVNERSIYKILAKLETAGISAENIAFGMGGALLQQINRDTARFAMKASAIKIDGEWHDVQKNPATDPTKASKAGRLALIREDSGKWMTVQRNGNSWRDELKPVFNNGFVCGEYSFAEIRERSNQF